MENSRPTLEELRTLAEKLAENVGEGGPKLLERFAALQQQRAARLASAEARLKVRLGEDHPRVVALRQAAAAAGGLEQALRTQGERAARRPRPGPHEWLVFGRVRDRAGQPQPDLRVRVFDRDRRYDDLLGETRTDAHGDFSVVYHARDFFEAGEGLAELYVMVSDARGNVLYTSREHLRYNAGRAEYFDVVLEARGQEPRGQEPPREEPPGRTEQAPPKARPKAKPRAAGGRGKKT
jgi:hypothetical protein